MCVFFCQSILIYFPNLTDICAYSSDFVAEGKLEGPFLAPSCTVVPPLGPFYHPSCQVLAPPLCTVVPPLGPLYHLLLR